MEKKAMNTNLLIAFLFVRGDLILKFFNLLNGVSVIRV